VRSVGWQDFAAGLDALLSEVDDDVRAEINEEVPKVARRGAKTVKAKAAACGWSGKTGERYVNGFHSKVTREGSEVSAEIGNEDVPGLVHLLEKGHNTLAGKRVAGKPHVAPAFEEISRDLEESVGEAVGKALGA